MGKTREPRKKALLVGINYFKQDGELRGCINDVNNLRNFLVQNGFKNDRSSITVLTDDGRGNGQPTRNNIMSAFMWLVHDNQPGDVLFFHYSGHGSQARDLNGDEADGMDETIVPVDFAKAGQIVDDDMHTMLVKPLRPGVRMYAVFDSCHSGTALDLPYVYSPSGNYEVTTRGVTKKEKKDKKEKDKKKEKKAEKKKWKGYKLKVGDQKKQQKNSSPAEVIMIAGCRDDQTSADVSMAGGQATGAMSFALMQELRSKKNPTMLEMLNGMRVILAQKKFTQVPQLSAGHEMDPDTVFSLD